MGTGYCRNASDALRKREIQIERWRDTIVCFGVAAGKRKKRKLSVGSSRLRARRETSASDSQKPGILARIEMPGSRPPRSQ